MLQATATDGSSSGSLIGTLSQRELQVLSLVSVGSTNSEIAEHLGVSLHAVKFHLGSVYRKLGVANRTEAAATLLTAPGHLVAPPLPEHS